MNGVYLILDPEQTEQRPPLAVAEAALSAGISALQWRQKRGSWAARWETLETLHDLCRRCGVPLLINDRVDVALALGADGAHVGQEDLPAVAARRLLPGRTLGVSVSDPGEVLPAEEAGADYLGVGPIFPTGSKPDAGPARGLQLLREVRALTDLPLVAIGGISVKNAAAVRQAGADSVAVISAVAGAPDVGAATRQLVQAFQEGEQ